MSFDSSTDSPMRRRRRNTFVPMIERCCSKTITNIPLALVYGLTTWALYVEATLSIAWAGSSNLGYVLLLLGVLFYGLLNWSYTVAAFTDPGSPLSPIHPTSSSSTRTGYSYLPTQEPAQLETQSLTVKAGGGTRFCKKCQTKKPDRAHHCSSCGRCVLKMDHHCPWLATCVGFRNYKPFILFCSYVTIFCWVCFAVSSIFLWTELLDADLSENALFGINTVLLVVMSGIFGLVLTGFTGWHLSLAWRNQTTIECLEKTRYLTPIRKGITRAQHAFDASPGEDTNIVQRYGQQLADIHANAIPGVTRVEEGEERVSPATRTGHDSDQLTAIEALRMNYSDIERHRERQRYEDYLDEKDSEDLPNAFDLGWRKNLEMLFGDQKLLWLLPIRNTIGDGWHWEPSARWLVASERLRIERETRAREYPNYEPDRTHNPPYTFNLGDEEDGRHYFSTSDGIASVPPGRRSPGKANQILGRSDDQYSDEYFGNGASTMGMQLRTLSRNRQDEDTSSTDGLYCLDDNHGVGVQEDDNGNRVENGRHSQDDWRDWD